MDKNLVLHFITFKNVVFECSRKCRTRFYTLLLFLHYYWLLCTIHHAELKKNLPSSKHAKQTFDTARATVLFSLVALYAASYVRKRTTAKHHASGTVKLTVLEL